MVFRILLLAVFCAATVNADIYRWDTGEVIPGTEGVEPKWELQLNLSGLDLEYADFQGQPLPGADLSAANLRHADLSNAFLGGAIFTNADLTGANVQGADLRANGLVSGMTKEQLYSTASYMSGDLRRIGLGLNCGTGCIGRPLVMPGWNFEGQELTGASFVMAGFTNANFFGANLSNAYFDTTSTLTDANLVGADLRNAAIYAKDVRTAQVDESTIYNQWTVFRTDWLLGPDFDPIEAGITLRPSPQGDLDASDILDAHDVRLLEQNIHDPFGTHPFWMPVAAFDFSGDGRITQEDLHVWVHDIKQTWIGDANLDGQFNSGDLITALAAGTYERDIEAGWASGDFDGSGRFDTSDLIFALADGGYEAGPRAAVSAVPEPTSVASFTACLLLLAFRHR